MTDVRTIEERRFAAITAMKAVVEALQTTNPQIVFPQGKDGTLDTSKLQAINNRWIDKAGDILEHTLELADRIGVDALDMFTGEPSVDAERSRASA